MTEKYRDHTYRVDLRQSESGAWFAKIGILRPDGSSLGPYAARTAHRDREFVKTEAQEFARSEIDRESDRIVG